MARFTFQVDREHIVKSPLQLYPDLEHKGAPFTLDPGDKVVYRGVIILGDAINHTFYLPDGKKGYSTDREQLLDGLEENFDAVAQMSYEHMVEV